MEPDANWSHALILEGPLEDAESNFSISDATVHSLY